MNEPSYWVELSETDLPFREAIRSAVEKHSTGRSVLRGVRVRIVSMPKGQRGATMVRGPDSEAVRVLMNVLYNVTGSAVSGCLVNG